MKIRICVHVSVMHLEPDPDISSTDLWIIWPLRSVPFIFDLCGKSISSWNWSYLEWQTWHWKGLCPLILLAGSQAISLDATWTLACLPNAPILEALHTGDIMRPLKAVMYLSIDGKIHLLYVIVYIMYSEALHPHCTQYKITSLWSAQMF